MDYLNRPSKWIVIAGLLFIVLGGCSEEEGPPSEIEMALNLSAIVTNPLSPAPGDSVIMTVRSSGSAPRGSEADFTWTVDAGSLSSNKGYSVRWYTPDSTGLYTISARGALDGIEKTLTRKIAIRNFEQIEPSPDIKTYYYPRMVTVERLGVEVDQLHFIGTPYNSDDFDANFNRYDGGGNTVFSLSTNFASVSHVVRHGLSDQWVYRGGNNFRFFPEEGKLVGSFIFHEGSIPKPPANVCIVDIQQLGSNFINITRDQDGVYGRFNCHTYPRANSDVSMVVWQQQIMGQARDGTKDLFNIGFCNNPYGGNPNLQTITQSVDTTMNRGDTILVYYRNIKPLFTPDQQNIIYFVDTTGTFEPCMVDLNGDEVDISTRRMMGGEDGIFGSYGVEISENTVFQWNPGFDVLGFIDDTGVLCFFDYLSGQVDFISAAGRVSEFTWAPDGSECVAANENGIVKVSLGGGAVSLFTKEVSTDAIMGLNWAGDQTDPRILYQVVRSGKSIVDTLYASYSALMTYSLNEDQYYYTTPRIPLFSVEAVTVPYPWMRTVYSGGESDDIFFPVMMGDGVVELYHSYK